MFDRLRSKTVFDINASEQQTSVSGYLDSIQFIRNP